MAPLDDRPDGMPGGSAIGEAVMLWICQRKAAAAPSVRPIGTVNEHRHHARAPFGRFRDIYY